MYKLLKLFLFSLFLSTTAIAQSLYVCESYTEDGSPIGPINKLEIKPYGTAFYILFDNENIIDDPNLYLFIDKFVDGKFTPYDSKTVTIENEANWVVTSFEFRENGIYEIYFLNSIQNKLARNKIEVSYINELNSSIITPTINSIRGCNFIFCELVIDGKPTNKMNSVSIENNGGEAFVYLDNYVPFGVEVIKMRVWNRSEENDDYERLIDEKKFKLLPEWKDTFFKYRFTKIGDYKIDIFDGENNFITSNIISVSN